MPGLIYEFLFKIWKIIDLVFWNCEIVRHSCIISFSNSFHQTFKTTEIFLVKMLGEFLWQCFASASGPGTELLIPLWTKVPRDSFMIIFECHSSHMNSNPPGSFTTNRTTSCSRYPHVNLQRFVTPILEHKEHLAIYK